MSTPLTAAVPTAPPRVTAEHAHTHAQASLGKLAFGALGIVYGDIGTSPLYAVKECVTLPHGVTATAPNILGLTSLIFWSLTFVVTVKYLYFVLRADNEGEGGVLALMALVAGRGGARTKWTHRLVLLGLFGAALLYGDGVITPAISVLSAIEGLDVATSTFHSIVVPLTCLVLVALFWAQKGGTSRIAAVFAPVTLVWFIAIAAAGLPWVLRAPMILTAVNPLHAVRFFIAHRWHGFLVLGSVVLCVTGGEALYADMGHFGRPAIRRAWIACVFPALLLNYFGQGALMLARPAAADNPFYALVPGPLLIPMVLLATAATVVASQALISGVFSLTRQAVQLGYLPRVSIIHTSARTEGQIYVPEVNWLLMIACVVLVIAFKESSRLAAAYGIAVTGTMGITSILFAIHARREWGWSRARAGTLLTMLLAFDLSFFAACSAKILNGGWFPLLVATAVFTVMTTWKTGRIRLAERLNEDALPLETFLDDLAIYNPHRVSGSAVFLTSVRRGTPSVLLRHFKHNHSIHQQVVLLSIVTDTVPEVEPDEIVHLKQFGLGFWGVTAHYGFMQSPDAQEILRGCTKKGLALELSTTSFYVGRETLIATSKGKGLASWRRVIFRFLSRNARSATEFFSIPANRVVEIGAQIEF